MGAGRSAPVKAFGDNSDGRTAVPDLAGKKVRQAAAGGYHTVLVLEDSSVKAFGNNSKGQTAVPDLAGKKVRQAAAGGCHTVLVLEDGSVKNFGWNSHGQTAVPDLAGKKVRQAAAGLCHTVLVLEDGSVKTFGWNSYGQTAVPDLAGKKVRQAAAGGNHTVLVLEDGSVKNFGWNSYGQTAVPDLAGKKVRQAAAGAHHTVLVLEDGSVKTSGWNSYGQTAVPDLAGKKVRQAAAGGGHTVLVLEDSSVKSFGSNSVGQTAVPYLTGKKVRQAAAGGGHTVLVPEDDTPASEPALEGRDNIPFLSYWLNELSLSQYEKQAFHWCKENGACSVDEILEYKDEFIRDLSLKLIEAGRIRTSGSDALDKIRQREASSHIAPPGATSTSIVLEAIDKVELVGSWEQLSWTDLASAGLRVAAVSSGNPLHAFIETHWRKTSGPHRLSRVELLDIPDAASDFVGRLKRLGGGRAEVPVLNPAFVSNPDALAGLDELKGHFQSKSPWVPVHANILLTWHGTNHSIAHSVAKHGLRPLRSTDGGYFGAGTYTSLEAWYAAQYAMPPFGVVANPAGEHAVLLLATVVGAAHVVTQTGDYTGLAGVAYAGFSDLFSPNPNQSKAMLPGCDTHFAPVKQFGPPWDFQACPNAEATAHEVVSADFSQCCPLAVCYFKP